MKNAKYYKKFSATVGMRGFRCYVVTMRVTYWLFSFNTIAAPTPIKCCEFGESPISIVNIYLVNFMEFLELLSVFVVTLT